MNILYFLNGEIVSARENADGSIDLIASDGTTRQAAAEEISAAKRLELREQINAERERREALGLTYQFPDAAIGTIQMRSATDFRNINGQVSAAMILISQGQTSPVMWFTDGENIRHENMTPADILALGMAVQQRIAALYLAAAALKAALATADPDTFDISAGWPA